jgi:deoxyribonuclease-4
MTFTRPRFGAHMSVAGGLHKAFTNATEVGCECLQVFVKNQRQWAEPPLSDEQVQLWQHAAAEHDIAPVVAHNTYLINLASPDATIWKKSIDAFFVELHRCEQLAIKSLVAHPGAHMGEGEAAGIRRIAKGINDLHKRTKGYAVRILLETTAGQGTSIGHTFEHLAAILAKIHAPERVGICVDTCHIFAAGYAITKPDDYAETMQELDAAVGLDRIACFHMNDSKRERGSRVDRHDHIGSGKIGRQAFKNIINDARFRDVPMILETPKGTDPRGRNYDKLMLAKLRRMATITATP